MNSTTFIANRRAALATLAALAASPAAFAQPWPAKPVKITVAYPPGGVADSVARLLADRLAPVLGQSVVVDNKAGASGSIGMDAVAKAAPDGHSLGFAAISPLVLNPHLGKSPFDPVKDIVPVVSVIASPVLLLGTSALAARDFKALIDAAKAKPGAVRWATSGPASLGHIVLEQVKAGTGADITHIPYKGGGQQINDALGGQFEVLSVNAGPAIMGHLKAGKLKALGVTTAGRSPLLPGVPAMSETIKGFDVGTWWGLVAPAGTPPEVINRLNAAFTEALRTPETQQRFAQLMAEPVPTTPEQFGQFMARERARYEQVVKRSGAKVD